ncbi:hypothetical protein V8C86DRAFT_2676594, partial [Haematococcus lacustris]
MGLLPGLSLVSLMRAAAAPPHSQVPMLEAALPYVSWQAGEEVQASPELKGMSSGFGSAPTAATTRPALAWPMLRKLGAGLWLTDPSALRDKVEALARSQFVRHKDAYEAALLYIALGKISTLCNLFKQASDGQVIVRVVSLATAC